MSEHSSVPLCGDCGQRPSLSVWRRRCDPCFESFLLRANQAKWDLRRHWAGFDAPGLPGRILRALAWDAAHENMDAVPWVERLTDDEFLHLRNMGPKSLARFREIVAAPTMEPDGALAAATARADGLLLVVEELRAALERAGTDLIGFEGYFERIGSMGTVASILVTLDTIDAILAADPEARASELLAAARR